MKKILLILLLSCPLSLHAASMTGTINVSLTILPSPCIATSTEQSVTVHCGNLKNDVKTVVEKQTSTEKKFRTLPCDYQLLKSLQSTLTFFLNLL